MQLILFDIDGTLIWSNGVGRRALARAIEEVAGVPLGFDAPLIHALIELEDGRKFICRIANCQEGELKEGAAVRLFAYEVPPMIVEKRGGVMEESPRMFFAFEPVK